MAGDKVLDDLKGAAPHGDAFNGLGGYLLSTRDATAALTPGQQRKQREYDRLHGDYLKDLDKYWTGVDANKTAGKFTLDFPPEYNGPKKPPWDKTPARPPSTLPNMNEMVAGSRDLGRFASGDSQRQDFSINRTDESTFKRRYVQEAARLGGQNGLSKDEVRDVVQSIYALEDGGWGTHDTLSSMPPRMVRPDKPGETKIYDERMNYRSSSTAIGYNQLLMFNSVREIHEHGGDMASELSALAQKDPARAKELTDKAKLLGDLSASLDKELKVMAATNPGKYIDANGKYKEDLYADFAKSGDPTEYSKSLPAGDPTKDQLTRRKLSIGIHGLNLDGDIGPLIQAQELGGLFSYANSHNFKQLLGQGNFGNHTAAELMPAVLELANLAGTDKALSMITPGNANYPTVNWFERAGYEGNPITNRKSAGELLVAIYDVMHGPKRDSSTHPGEADFDRAFDGLP